MGGHGDFLARSEARPARGRAGEAPRRSCATTLTSTPTPTCAGRAAPPPERPLPSQRVASDRPGLQRRRARQRPDARAAGEGAAGTPAVKAAMLVRAEAARIAIADGLDP